MRLILAVLLAVCSSLCSAASLDWAGEVGNSGATGEAWSVVRGAIGRSGGGVVVDRAGRIITGGGDRVLVLSRDGKLLWDTALPQSDWLVSGSAFAIAGKYLYFLAGHALLRSGFMNLLWPPYTEVEPNLCRVEMYPGAKAQVLVPFKKLGWTDPWFTGTIPVASDPTDGSVYVGGFNKDGYVVYRVESDGTLVQQFKAPGGRFSIDEAGRWYFGGSSMMQVDKTGKIVPGTQPVPLPSLGAVASQYRGEAMVTRNQIWDQGIYGFVGRFTRQFQPDPGAVSQWNHALYYVTQIADAPNGDYYIESIGGLYLAKVADGQLVLMRRFGSICSPTALCLLPSGYIGVGDDATNFHWYNFANSDPAAAPVRSEAPGPSAQGYVAGNIFYTYQIGDYSAPLEYSPGSMSLALSSFHAEPYTDGGNLATRISTGTYPVSQIATVTKVGSWVFALDTKLNKLLRGTEAAPTTLTALDAAHTVPGTITGIAPLGADTLLVATDHGIAVCAIDASGGLNVRWTFQLPDSVGPFGKQVSLACDGDRIVAADTDRDRVVVLRADDTASTLTYVAQFGATDAPGSDDRSLDAPTLVSCSSGRTVVYDSGNQRIVKLLIRE